MADMDDWDKKNIKAIDVTNADYLDAIRIAQEGMDIFIKLFDDRQNNRCRFYIKAKFQEGDEIEHLWLIPVLLDAEVFTAVVDNEPGNLREVKYKEKVKVHRKDVEDWFIQFSDGETLGNFISHTIK